MKKSKFFVAVLVSMLLSVVSLVPAQTVYAVRPPDDTNDLACNISGVTNDWSGSTTGCDLQIKKYVSVNGGATQDANDPGSAPIANVGDTALWTIEITNNSGPHYDDPEGPNMVPGGEAKVTDIVPTSVTVGSSGRTSGDFDGTTWHIDLSAHSYFMMTIVTTVNTAGTIQNTATISELNYDFDPLTLDADATNFIPYSDAIADNNSDGAFIRQPSTGQVLGSSTTSTPQVLAATTLAETGINAFTAQLIIISGATLVGLVAILLKKKNLSYRLR